MAFDAEKHLDELIEILEPEIGTETGNDGYVYGNYIDWSATGLTNEKYVELIDLMDIADKVWDRLHDEEDPKGLLDGKAIDDLETTEIVDIADKLGALDHVYDLMGDEGLPSGTVYENDPDFPPQFRYYQE